MIIVYFINVLMEYVYSFIQRVIALNGDDGYQGVLILYVDCKAISQWTILKTKIWNWWVIYNNEYI